MRKTTSIFIVAIMLLSSCESDNNICAQELLSINKRYDKLIATALANDDLQQAANFNKEKLARLELLMEKCN